jgi:hypothetical protein
MSEPSNIELPAVVRAKDVLSKETGYTNPKNNYKENKKIFMITIVSMVAVIIVAVLALGA